MSSSSKTFDSAKSRQIGLNPVQNGTATPLAANPSVQVVNNTYAGGSDLPIADSHHSRTELQTPVAIVMDRGILNGVCPNTASERFRTVHSLSTHQYHDEQRPLV